MIKTLKCLEKKNQAIQKSLNKLYHEQSITKDEIRIVKSSIIKSKKLLSGIWKFDRYDDSTFSILSYDKFDDVDELVNGRCGHGGHWGITIVGPEYSSNNEEQACLRYDDGDYRIEFENYTPKSIKEFCDEWGITINFEHIYEQIKKLENDLNNIKQVIKVYHEKGVVK